MLYLIAALLAIASSAQAAPDADYCRQAQNDAGELNEAYFQDLAARYPSETQLSFRNYGGLFNGGVCWWHSRFTRNALYLAAFRPDRPKLSKKRARAMIRRLQDGKRVAEIDGYANLREFSRDYPGYIHWMLAVGQFDAAIDFGWLHGLEGGHLRDPAALEAQMDSLYGQVVNEHQVVYQMLKLPGIEAHAWLVVSMEATGDGYRLNVIDSNRPGRIMPWIYQRGTDHLADYYGDGEFSPYTQEEHKFTDYGAAVRAYCGH